MLTIPNYYDANNDKPKWVNAHAVAPSFTSSWAIQYGVGTTSVHYYAAAGNFIREVNGTQNIIARNVSTFTVIEQDLTSTRLAAASPSRPRSPPFPAPARSLEQPFTATPFCGTRPLTMNLSTSQTAGRSVLAVTVIPDRLYFHHDLRDQPLHRESERELGVTGGKLAASPRSCRARWTRPSPSLNTNDVAELGRRSWRRPEYTSLRPGANRRPRPAGPPLTSAQYTPLPRQLGYPVASPDLQCHQQPSTSTSEGNPTVSMWTTLDTGGLPPDGNGNQW